MKLEEAVEIEEMLKDLRGHPVALKMKQFTQHGEVSTYEHCMNVVKLSYFLNKHLRIGSDVEVLLTGAFLHDLCLYDWHDKDPTHRLHGYRHAGCARKNAIAYFHIGEREQHIIWCHMWPLNLTRLPKSREAWLVCLADKLCAIYEMIK